MQGPAWSKSVLLQVYPTTHQYVGLGKYQFAFIY